MEIRFFLTSVLHQTVGKQNPGCSSSEEIYIHERDAPNNQLCNQFSYIIINNSSNALREESKINAVI